MEGGEYWTHSKSWCAKLLFKNSDKVFCSSSLQSWGGDARPSPFASMLLGVRRWEYPLRGPFCSADPVVGVVVQRKGEQAERTNAAEGSKHRQRDSRLSSEGLPPHRPVTFTTSEKRTFTAQGAGTAAATGSAPLEPVAETPQGGLLSWHELTYQVKHGNQTFLVIG